jgi:peptide-methionine (S)-S-oxide reductase
MPFIRFVTFVILVFSALPDHLLAGDSNWLLADTPGVKTATFGAGCFWCVEAVFLDLAGVSKVVSGYSGGTVRNPTYREVCEGNTGHAEVVQVYYHPAEISYEELLEVFWSTHDPTTLNRQGNDVGPQYRSVIFYHDEEQKELAQYFLRILEESESFDNPVVTAIEPFRNFYIAEDYHQNYYNLNQQLPYCRIVIEPKLEKFRKVFADKLKK